jgi:hypothetical protein
VKKKKKVFRYFNYQQLIKHKPAIKDILSLNKIARFPVYMHMIHNDAEVRCRVALDSHGSSVEVTLPIGDFNNLPTYEG